tara:strand:- start:572 stop:1243 length:672 start_codon:yes stop_codon:yes gene_type:complete
MKPQKYAPNKKPWPTKDAMEQVYELNLWGGNNSSFYSGDGSYNANIVDPYLKVVLSFLNSFDEPLNVVDLGCGDFNIGNQLMGSVKNYIAVDIVEKLIERNKKIFNSNNLEFYSLDIAKDSLPDGDCAILRQVLQHLSNKEVNSIIQKLFKYKYVLLTEHIPVGKFHPNIDVISGQGIRLKKNSGLDLFSPPFDLKVKKVTEIVSIRVKKMKGEIVTALLEMY